MSFDNWAQNIVGCDIYRGGRDGQREKDGGQEERGCEVLSQFLQFFVCKTCGLNLFGGETRTISHSGDLHAHTHHLQQTNNE